VIRLAESHDHHRPPHKITARLREAGLGVLADLAASVRDFAALLALGDKLVEGVDAIASGVSVNTY
jgi:uncharacterized protein